MLGLTCLRGTGLMEEQMPPSRATQMKASEPINRAILQTIFKITIALYCSNQYAQYMLNVYEYTLLFLFFENVRNIFSFSFLLNFKKKKLKTFSSFKLLRHFVLVCVGHLQLSNLVGQ